MNKRHENYFLKLKATYPIELLQSLEKYNEEPIGVMEWTKGKNIKIRNFLRIVLPSLCSKFYDQSELFANHKTKFQFDPNNQKFICLFSSCIFNCNFASRQSLIRHILAIHATEIPVGGDLLVNHGKYGIKPVLDNPVYKCDYCQMEFKFLDDYNEHTSTKEFCNPV